MRITFAFHNPTTGDTSRIDHNCPGYDPQRYAMEIPEFVESMAAHYSPGEDWITLQSEARDSDGVLLYSDARQPVAA